MFIKTKEDRFRDYERVSRIYLGDPNVFSKTDLSKMFEGTKFNSSNFVRQAIQTDIALILYMEDNNKDIYIDMKDEKLKDFIYEELFKNNFPIVKETLADNFCACGDGFLKIYTDENDVRFKNVSPEYVTHMEKDSRENITKIIIEYKDDNWNEYTEEYNLQEFVWKKNGAITDRFPNNYGIVPFVHWKLGNNFWGESIIDAIWELLKNDAEINTIAKTCLKSYIEKIFHMSANQKQKDETMKNIAQSPANLNKGSRILVTAEGTKLDVINPTEIPTTYLQYLDKLEQNIERLLPELSMDVLLTNANGSGVALSVQLSKLKNKINGMQQRFISSFNLFLYYYLIILKAEKKINVDVEKLKFNTHFDNFIDATYNRELKVANKNEIKEKIARKKNDIDKSLQYLSAGIFDKEEVKEKILKLENEVEELEKQLENLNNIKFN